MHQNNGELRFFAIIFDFLLFSFFMILFYKGLPAEYDRQHLVITRRLSPLIRSTSDRLPYEYRSSKSRCHNG